MRLTVCAAVSCLLLSSPLVSAFVVRDAPILNSTTGHNSASDSPATPSLDLPSNPQTQTATRTQEHTAFKPKFETSVSGFEENIKPSPSRNERPLQSSVDIGSIIASWISVVPTIHYESTATGFDEQYTRTREQAPERFEVTVTDFMGDDKATKGGQQDAVITPPPNKPPTVTLNTRTLSPVPIASVVINDQTLTPGGDTATIPAGSGAEPTKIHLDPSGRPVIVVGTSTSTVRPSTVIDGQTLEPEGPPVTVGTGFEITTFSINPAGQTLAIHEGLTSTLPAAPTQGVFTVGSITATPLASDMQYLVDSSRLVLGTPITIDGTRIALTTDTSGLTILAVGDKTTTLMPNIQAQMQSQAQEPLSIPTIVVDGTTQYIIGTETLSPNHPITVDGTVISMRTMSGATVLVVGDKTTTIGAMATTTGASAVRTTSAGGGEGALASATATGKKNGAGNVVDKGRSSVILGALVGVLGVAVG